MQVNARYINCTRGTQGHEDTDRAGCMGIIISRVFGEKVDMVLTAGCIFHYIIMCNNSLLSGQQTACVVISWCVLTAGCMCVVILCCAC